MPFPSQQEQPPHPRLRSRKPNEIWQTDVTVYPEFGKPKYIHAFIDTYLGFIFVSAHTKENTKAVFNICMLLQPGASAAQLRQIMAQPTSPPDL